MEEISDFGFGPKEQLVYIYSKWIGSNDQFPKTSSDTGPSAHGAAHVTVPSNSVAEPTTDAMDLDSTEPKTATEDAVLERLAHNLDLITPQSPFLSEDDRHDLALFDLLVRAQARIQQAIGVESEIVETEKWNFDAIKELLELTHITSSIPFGKRTDLFDLKPMCGDPSTAETVPPGKGKQHSLAERASHKRSIYHTLPDEEKLSWAGSYGKFPCYLEYCSLKKI